MTRVLSLCGAALPRNVLRENEWNARGYWEPARALDINDAFLNEHASSWWDPRPYVHDVRLDDPRAQRFVARIAELLRDEYPSDGTIVVKDPRISGLFPFWRAAAEQLDFRAKVVQVVRHPDEVSASLRRRDFAHRTLSHLLWLKYNLLGLSDARDVPNIVVGYADVLDDWETVTRSCIDVLGLDLCVTDDVREAVDDFLMPQLRHHHREHRAIDDATTGHFLTKAFGQLYWARGTSPSHETVADLTKGFRGLPEVATSGPMIEDVPTLPVTTRMMGATDEIWIDGGWSVPSDGVLVVGPAFTFDASGWALRVDGYVAVDRIVVLHEERPVALAVAEHRTDVADLYGPQSGLCGFRVRVQGPAGEGNHRFDIFAVAAGKRTRIGSIALRVIRHAARKTTPLIQLRLADATRAADHARTQIEGWGFDPRTAGTFAGAALLVDDDLVIPCRYGTARPDVQNVFDAPDDRVGFTSYLDDRAIEPGRHVVRALGVPYHADDHIWVSERSIAVDTPR